MSELPLVSMKPRVLEERGDGEQGEGCHSWMQQYLPQLCTPPEELLYVKHCHHREACFGFIREAGLDGSGRWPSSTFNFPVFIGRNV